MSANSVRSAVMSPVMVSTASPGSPRVKVTGLVKALVSVAETEATW